MTFHAVIKDFLFFRACCRRAGSGLSSDSDSNWNHEATHPHRVPGHKINCSDISVADYYSEQILDLALVEWI